MPSLGVGKRGLVLLNGNVWPCPDKSLAAYVQERRGRTLYVYRTELERLEEDFNTEESVLAGSIASSVHRYRRG